MDFFNELDRIMALCILGIFLVLAIIKKWYINKSRMFFQVLMMVYFVCVVTETFDSVPIGNLKIANLENINETLWQMQGMGRINLKIFDGAFRQDQFLNILMAIPFGVLMPFIKKQKIQRYIIKAASFGVIIEIGQLCVNILGKRGYRIIDIDDVLCNFVGGLIGIVIFYLLRGIFRLFKNKFSNKRFFWYIKKIIA